MNKFSTLNGSIGFVIPLLLCLLPFSANAQAQCVLACNDLITIKIPPGGSVEFLPDAMLEGDPSTSCPNGIFSAQAYIDNVWVPSSGNYVFDYSQVGQVFQARIRDSNSGNSCWGNVQILEDNLQSDTVRFKLCTELWKDQRPVKGVIVKFQPHNSSFPYNPLLYQLSSDQHCIDMTVVPNDYLSGTTFEYGAELMDNDDLNGVNSIDLCKISEHILGINPLLTYALFAADANMSQSVTTFDMVEIRKLIEGLYTAFPNNTSWRTFPDYCTFPNPANPFQFSCPGGIDLSGLQALDGDTAKVICVKTGDVDGSVVLPGETYVPPAPYDSVGLILPVATFVAGAPIKIPVKFDKSFNFTRLQLSFFLNSGVAQFDSISDGTLNINQFDAYFNPSTNRLKITTGDFNVSQYHAGDRVFYIHLRPIQVGELQNNLKLQLNDPLVKSFALGPHCSDYIKLGSAYSGMVATQTPDIQGIRVTPPSPNPFTGASSIQIEMEKALEAQLELFDAAGRLLAREKRSLPAGVSQWELPVENVPAGSFCIWRLSIEGGRVQGKLFRA